MASSGKRKTTMSKLNREARLRERRFEKETRKQIRKQAQLHPQPVAAFASEFFDAEELPGTDLEATDEQDSA